MAKPALRVLAVGRWQRLRRALPSLMVVAALGAWLLPISLGRLIDGDEGYLLMAARLIGEGHWPYRDFFLTQTPLLPAVLGAVFRIFGRSWLTARVFSGALAVVMGWLVYRESLSATRRQSAALFAAAVFALNGASIGWLTIVKGLWPVGGVAARSRRFGRLRREAGNRAIGRSPREDCDFVGGPCAWTCGLDPALHGAGDARAGRLSCRQAGP